MEFQPVWISSIDHLIEFNRIIKNSSLFDKLSGNYHVPNNFPQMKLHQSNYPTIYFANGDLLLHKNKATFTPTEPPLTNSLHKVEFLNSEQVVAFEVSYSSIFSIELYQHPDSAIRQYNFEWIRLLTKSHTLNGDFLICVGNHSYSTKSIKQNTRLMYENLIDFTIDSNAV